MQTIEIRPNKKTLIPTLVLFVISLIGETYYVYFSGRFDDTNTMRLIYIILTVSLAYAIYIHAKRIIKNEPVIILTKDGIEINEKGKSVSFLWLQIVSWRIEKDDNTHYLIIETVDTKKKINISWLEKKPGEIESLLNGYKKH